MELSTSEQVARSRAGTIVILTQRDVIKLIGKMMAFNLCFVKMILLMKMIEDIIIITYTNS